MLSRHTSLVGACGGASRAAAAIFGLNARPAAAVAASSSALFAGPNATVASSLGGVRFAHNPRRIRGVGPAPRTIAFFKRPWLKRRLTQVRAKFWPITHPTAPLVAPIQQLAPQQLSLPTRNFQTAEETGSVSLSPDVFGVPLRRDIVWEVVRWQRACRRTGNHKNKDRSEVFGSGKKARPQKGTGRARMGDPHAPHHVGGGNTWARRPTDYSYPLPQHIINLGKRVALSAKYAEGNLVIVDAPSLDSSLPSAFMDANVRNQWGTYLMIHLDGELDPNLALASRKYAPYNFLSDKQLNVYDIVNAKRLVITRRALQAIEWRLRKANTSNRTQARRMRWMVGSFGGGYTRSQIEFVRPEAVTEADGKIVPNVDVDGLKLMIKAGEKHETPIHWP